MVHEMRRYEWRALAEFATALLERAGVEAEKAEVTAEGLVAADAMGHSTHGLALLPQYLEEIAAGSMACAGLPEIVVDREAAQVWDGLRLPGLWLAARALGEAAKRAARLGTASVVIRRSHHLGALAALLAGEADAGRMALITCSDPSAKQVVPFGGVDPVLTPDPLAAVIPTKDGPILIDISTSITTAAMTSRLAAEGRRFPGPWAVDGSGTPTDDPGIFDAAPPGALLPIGGLDHGHKGFALGLLVEALTQGLSGYGRADGETRWGASVYIQVWDPACYGGLASFRRQTSWLAAACRASRPRDPLQPMRLPGERAFENLAEARAEGVGLYLGIMPGLERLAGEWGVGAPAPLSLARPLSQARFGRASPDGSAGVDPG
jgi:LDH2 family malate/lactate/ureidoglycolate dehydrogenase